MKHGKLDIIGGQIAFPADAVPSGDPNTIDDYEEGTWTPSIGGNTTYTTQNGQYIKVGKKVTVWGDIKINVLGTGSTTALVGLPFLTAADALIQTGSVSYFKDLAVNVLFVSLYAGASGTTILFISAIAATNDATNAPAIFGNTANIVFSLSYKASD